MAKKQGSAPAFQAVVKGQLVASPAAYNAILNTLASSRPGRSSRSRNTSSNREQSATINAFPQLGGSSAQTPFVGPLPSSAATQPTAPGNQDITKPVTNEDFDKKLDERVEKVKGEFTSQIGGLQAMLDELRAQKEQQQAKTEPTAPTPTTQAGTQNTTSTSITTEEFDPFNRELFTGLLGELEASKKRQKDWDYEQASRAYKF